MKTTTLFILIVVHNPFCDAISKVFHSQSAAEKHALDMFDQSDSTWSQFQDWLVQNRAFTQIQIQQISLEL
jgi:hypothetical protein